MKPTSTIRIGFSGSRLVLGCAVFLWVLNSEARTDEPRYPSGFAMDPGDRLIFTANRGNRSLSVLEIKTGELLQELPLPPGARPAQVLPFLRHGKLEIALSDDGTHCVRIYSVTDGPPVRLKEIKKIQTGRRPHGLAFDPRADRLFIACSEEGTVWIIDLDKGNSPGSIRTVEGARHLCLLSGKNGRASGGLAIGGRKDIGLVHTGKKAGLGETPLSVGRGLNISGLVSGRGSLFVSHQVQPTQVAVDPQMIVWGLILSNRVTSIPVATLAENADFPQRRQSTSGSENVYGVGYEGGDPRHSIFPLDQRHRANGDPGSPALVRREGARGDLLLLPSGGTNRVLFINTEDAYLPGTEPLSRQDAIPSIDVGSRPISVITDSPQKRAYILCSLEDSIWEIDIASRKVLRKIRIAAPPAPSREHLGARIFFNSRRSKGGWYSCHSCHPEGGSRGHTFDTHSDGDGLSKKAPNLHGVAFSRPWAWNGRFKQLADQVEASLHSTMAVNHPPSSREVANVVAFLRSLEHVDTEIGNGHLGGNPRRGENLFKNAGCASCHTPPYFTIPDLKDVGVFDEYDGYRKYNPPSLLGVRDKVRYLHDGRAKTLRSVFTKHNPEKKHGKAHTLTPQELDDLIAYLKTL